MPTSFFFRAHKHLKSRRVIFPVAALILLSTTFLPAQQSSPTPAPKTAPEKPKSTPDDSASASHRPWRNLTMPSKTSPPKSLPP